MNESTTPEPSVAERSPDTTGLVLLFAAMYFVQGIAEPTEGLIAQPVRSLLRSWGRSAGEIGAFGAILALPWSLKPLYGLLTDFVPLAGTRRRSYLILTSGATVAGLTWLYFFPPGEGEYRLLLLLLLVPTVGVAFSDVVVDGLMVEKGQPRGLTGRLQSVQWASMYAATIVAGFLGGYLSQHQRQDAAFLICAALTLVTLFLAWGFVHEDRREQRALRALRFSVLTAMRLSWRLARKPKVLAVFAMLVLRRLAYRVRRRPQVRTVLAVAAFLALWSFNPFSTAVLYVHMTEELGMSEQFYGVTVSLLSVGAILGSLAYGAYCRRVPLPWLIHLSILMGVLATLAYWGLRDEATAGAISLAVGFTYMTGWLVQLDLAARVCPVAAAGTTFALLMGLTNFSFSLSAAVGGHLYDRWSAASDASTAFNLLVAVGALTTCACWLIAPFLIRAK